jgi:uncharacterized repeat protein (TIGR01451 family)
MINKTKKLAIILICGGLVLPIFTYAVSSPTAQITVNGSSDSPITVSYDSSVTFTWYSSNTDSCEASGGWSGTKATSGTEVVNNVRTPGTYIITCTGAGGSASAQIEIKITNIPTFLQVSKLVQNISDVTSYVDVVPADPGEKLSFQIQVTVGPIGLQNAVVKDILPSRITYLGNLKIDGVPSSGDIISGLDIGDLAGNQTKIITFDGIIADTNQFDLGITTLINSVLVYNSLLANSDTAKIIINKATGGGPTNVPTGITNNLFYDSFLLPLVMTLLIIWIFKSHIIKFEEWLDLRKKEYQEYRARKLLNKIRTRELFKEFEHRN